MAGILVLELASMLMPLKTSGRQIIECFLMSLRNCLMWFAPISQQTQICNPSWVIGVYRQIILTFLRATPNIYVSSIYLNSMGGHGALVCALKNPGLYKSVSAFAPICNPVKCPWGEKAFSGYLGTDKTAWQEWDATCLVSNYQGPPLEIFVDQVNSQSYSAIPWMTSLLAVCVTLLGRGRSISQGQSTSSW